MSQEKTLRGRRALVTGASRGLGRGIALELAGAGARVAINYLNAAAEAEQLRQEIEGLGSEAILVQADVSDEGEVEQMFSAIDAQWEGLDILVNNAGTTKSQTIDETSLDDWDFILRTNLTSAFLCSRAAMERMKARGGGRIVNISSVVGHRGAQFGHVHYASTKSGMFGFTKTLARTGAEYGITVNCVAPGIIETELLTQTHGVEGVEKLTAGVPLGLGKPRDIGLAVAFLCGEGGRYITGETLNVNGGMDYR
jgi:3-oxoacyl-[acyl-carrier protein] reductase